MHLLFLCLVLTSLVTGATLSPIPPSHPHRFVVEFDEEPDGNTKVSISQKDDNSGGFTGRPRELFGKCKYKLASVIEKTKNVVSGKTNDVSSKFGNLEEQAKDVINEAVGKFGDSKVTLAEKVSEKVNVVGEKAKEVAGKARSSAGKLTGRPEVKSSGNLWEKVKLVGEKAKEVVGKARSSVGKSTDTEVKSSGNVWEKVKVVGIKAKQMAGTASSLVGKTLGTLSIGGGTKGALKDSVVKVGEWDLVDSPKRIGEDIERNASRIVDSGVEEVKETVEIVRETSLHDLLTRTTRKVTVLVDTIQSVISWCHLLGFSMAYGMWVWVTFISSSVLGKCLPKLQHQMIANKLYMVYFRAMAYCIGTALIGFLVGRWRKVFYLSNMMDIFQGLNLLSALIMSLTNMMYLEPQATKLVDERKKMNEERGPKSVAAKKLKKLNTYASTLNVSTMVMLTWHLAYVGQLLEAARHP
ncbi:hypothetical protein LXL04_031836 [Taraxacum kok-saghyz]